MDFHKLIQSFAHFSEDQSDLKQNGTQKRHHFQAKFFHVLSNVAICFDAGVSSKKTLLSGWNASAANHMLRLQLFFETNYQQIGTHHVKGH